MLDLIAGALDHVMLGSIIGALDRSSCAIDHTSKDQIFLCSFPPFKPHFDANDLQHNKTPKLTKTLENNKTKSLTNISYGTQIYNIWHSSINKVSSLAS
jgi:hypothetical protein